MPKYNALFNILCVPSDLITDFRLALGLLISMFNMLSMGMKCAVREVSDFVRVRSPFDD